MSNATKIIERQTEMISEFQLTVKRLRSLIPGCDCLDPLQCLEPCRALGHEDKYARVIDKSNK